MRRGDGGRGGAPTGGSTARTVMSLVSMLASSDMATASRGLPSVYDWSGTDSVSFVRTDHYTNRSADNV